MIKTYAPWAWNMLKRDNIKSRIDQAYFDWIDSRYLDCQILNTLPNVAAHQSTKVQINRLLEDMLTNNYPQTYVLNHPIARSDFGRSYALLVLDQTNPTTLF